MRERIARALAVAEGKDPDAPAWCSFPGPRTWGICWRDQYGKQADAVLDAMREPDAGMIAAGDTTYEDYEGWDCPRVVWQLMIDAARNLPADGGGER